RQIRLTLKHFGRRDPVRPFRFTLNRLYAGPGEAFTANTDSVTDGLAATNDVIEIGVRRINNDRARRFARRIIDDVTVQACGNVSGCLDFVGRLRLARGLAE